MKSWFVVYTHPREEAVAQENLERQGFETYWPRYLRRTSHARRVTETGASLFPRYLFAAFDAGVAGWRAIRSTRGVADLVRNGIDPVPVPASLIDEIRSREDIHGYVVLADQIQLTKGQPIEIMGTAFRGQRLIFEARKDSDRVLALLSLLGREHEVEVPVGRVLPAA